MYYVYVLRSTLTGHRYVGSTDDLKERMRKHNAGEVVSTKPHRPWCLLYYEAHLTKTLARRAEQFYKKSQGRRQMKKKLGLV